jgi:hypothetical protein
MSGPRSAPSWLLVALLSTAAHASFGGKPCGPDFACHFEAWGLLLGAVAAPNSAFLFVLLHTGFRHPARSRMQQIFLGAFAGIAAWAVAAACAALLGSRGLNPLTGLVPVYVLLAIASALCARSAPRGPSAGSGRPAAG